MPILTPYGCCRSRLLRLLSERRWFESNPPSEPVVIVNGYFFWRNIPVDNYFPGFFFGAEAQWLSKIEVDTSRLVRADRFRFHRWFESNQPCSAWCRFLVHS